MLSFSEQLNEYMKAHAVSTVDLAKETGIDRTAIYRYIKGTRIPSNATSVRKIADALQMSIREREELLEAYEKLAWGEENVYSWQFMREQLESFDSLEEVDSAFYDHWKISRELQMDTDILALNSKEEIVTCVLNLLSYVAEKKNTQTVYLAMQPIYGEIQKYILPTFRNGSIEVEQIICMEQNRDKGYENLKIFQEILPLCFGMENYDAYYYYDSLCSHLNDMSGLTNLILVQDYVVQFDFYMQNGIVSKNPVYYGVMYQQYKKMRKQSQQFMFRVNNIANISQRIDLLGSNGCSFFRQLCMGFCVSKAMYEEHIHFMPGKKEFIDGMITSHGDWQGEKYIAGEFPVKRIVSYGSREGMEEFMKNGRIQEFPAGLYEPFSVEERKIILERLIRLGEMGVLSYRLLPESMKISPSIQLYWSENLSGISLNYIKPDKIQQIMIREQSIYRTYGNCMRYLEQRGIILGEEDSIKWLKELKERCV